MPTDEATTILKRDVLGRVTITKEQREALLDEFERSGLKGTPFVRWMNFAPTNETPLSNEEANFTEDASTSPTTAKAEESGSCSSHSSFSIRHSALSPTPASSTLAGT
jgi:hypothetical protein